jgi:RNA polymerase sigma-70 factor, ECF subfamily
MQSLESDMDDLQSIHRLKNGDIGGLEILIARYQAKAVRTAYLVTHNEPLAEDVVQEVFIRLYERIRYFDESRAFEPYLLRSVVNSALNTVKKEKRSLPLDEDVKLPAIETLLARAASVEDLAEYAQQRDEIRNALAALSPRQRVAVVQRYYLDMSEKEMTEMLEVAPGTVKWLLNAARRRLRALLGSERRAE